MRYHREVPRRTQPLVSQYLEGVSRKALEKYREAVQEFLRGRNGISALYRGGKLYYVGLARNLWTRLKDHLDPASLPNWLPGIRRDYNVAMNCRSGLMVL